MNSELTGLMWENDVMRKLDEDMRRASQTDANVMLTGESGVGKRFAANMIHQLSQRRRAPFVAINAAAAWDTGSDTTGDATDPLTEGLLLAENGTLFIQDIEKVPSSAQSHLYQFMDWAAIAGRSVRFMTATGVDLFELVEAGEFREDLYYRLNVFRFVIPPLRERPEDIPLMFQHYLSLHTRDGVPALSTAARRRLVEYSWPGNIRELRSLTRRLSTERLPDLIEPEHLPCPIGE